MKVDQLPGELSFGDKLDGCLDSLRDHYPFVFLKLGVARSEKHESLNAFRVVACRKEQIRSKTLKSTYQLT
jgi:hypothetical protein